jgi:hypothetical protein
MKKLENKTGGFLQLIILIVIGLFLLNYFHITFADFIVWLKTAIQNVF